MTAGESAGSSPFDLTARRILLARRIRTAVGEGWLLRGRVHPLGTVARIVRSDPQTLRDLYGFAEGPEQESFTYPESAGTSAFGAGTAYRRVVWGVDCDGKPVARCERRPGVVF